MVVALPYVSLSHLCKASLLRVDDMNAEPKKSIERSLKPQRQQNTS